MAASVGPTALVHVNVGGVPEHFNRPWHMAREQGLWAEQGLSVSWRGAENVAVAFPPSVRCLQAL